MFTEAQLVSFGNFLLKTYGVQVHSTDGKNQPIYQREVSHADVCNWKDENPIKDFGIKLPSRFQIGDEVLFYYIAEGRAETFPAIGAFILAIHFYEGKVKYDLELKLGEYKSRIYNVDSALVTNTPEITT